MKYNVLLMLFLSGSIQAQELPSEETLGEMVRDSAVDVLFINSAIAQIESGDIEEAKRTLCTSLESNLIVLFSLAKYAPTIESKALKKSVAHIANADNGCEFSKDIKEFLINYK